MLVTYLTDPMELLQPGRIDGSHVRSADQYRATFGTLTGGPAWSSTPLPRGALPVHRAVSELPY